MVENLKKEENTTIVTHESKKFQQYKENLENLEKKAEEILKNLNIEEIRSEIAESKKMIEVIY